MGMIKRVNFGNDCHSGIRYAASESLCSVEPSPVAPRPASAGVLSPLCEAGAGTPCVSSAGRVSQSHASDQSAQNQKPTVSGAAE